jgi:hypothetical protein
VEKRPATRASPDNVISGSSSVILCRNEPTHYIRRHQIYHLRPYKCNQCGRGFPTPKDLERHDNSVHNNTIKYFCPYDWCRDSVRQDIEECIVWGFRRKDHWQKHLKAEHQASVETVKEFQKNGFPVAVLKDEKWAIVLPGSSTDIKDR